jgi:hypothetical protein
VVECLLGLVDFGEWREGDVGDEISVAASACRFSFPVPVLASVDLGIKAADF